MYEIYAVHGYGKDNSLLHVLASIFNYEVKITSGFHFGQSPPLYTLPSRLIITMFSTLKRASQVLLGQPRGGWTRVIACNEKSCDIR